MAYHGPVTRSQALMEGFILMSNLGAYPNIFELDNNGELGSRDIFLQDVQNAQDLTEISSNLKVERFKNEIQPERVDNESESTLLSINLPQLKTDEEELKVVLNYEEEIFDTDISPQSLSDEEDQSLLEDLAKLDGYAEDILKICETCGKTSQSNQQLEHQISDEANKHVVTENDNLQIGKEPNLTETSVEPKPSVQCKPNSLASKRKFRKKNYQMKNSKFIKEWISKKSMSWNCNKHIRTNCKNIYKSKVLLRHKHRKYLQTKRHKNKIASHSKRYKNSQTGRLRDTGDKYKHTKSCTIEHKSPNKKSGNFKGGSENRHDNKDRNQSTQTENKPVIPEINSSSQNIRKSDPSPLNSVEEPEIIILEEKQPNLSFHKDDDITIINEIPSNLTTQQSTDEIEVIAEFLPPIQRQFTNDQLIQLDHTDLKNNNVLICDPKSNPPTYHAGIMYGITEGVIVHVKRYDGEETIPLDVFQRENFNFIVKDMPPSRPQNVIRISLLAGYRILYYVSRYKYAVGTILNKWLEESEGPPKWKFEIEPVKPSPFRIIICESEIRTLSPPWFHKILKVNPWFGNHYLVPGLDCQPEFSPQILSI